MKNKQRKIYWNCITKNSSGDILTTLWYGTADAISRIIPAYDFIIPLDRKPRNYKGTIKQA